MRIGILTRLGVLGFFLLGMTQLPAQVNVTKTDSLIYDANGNLLANPGDSLRYKTNVKNLGAGNVTGAIMDVNPSANLGPATNFRTTPVAVNDTFDVTANIGISVDSTNGLKPNDFDDDYAGTTLLPEVKMSTMGGDVTINADGSFIYIPDAGFTGTDDFTYTLLDGNTVPGCPPSNNAIVLLNVAGAPAVIWFIDNAGGGSGGTGTVSDPFKTLADFNSSSGPQPGHTVFVENTGTNYSGGIILENNQILWGTGHTGGSNLADLITEAPFSLTLPSINGTRPILEGGLGDGILLASGNSIRGLNVGNSADFAIDDNGNVGALTISEVAINTSGGGFRTDAGGTLAVALTSLASNNLNGINLNNIGGSFTSGTTNVQTPSVVGIQVENSSVSFSLGNTTVNKSAAGTGVFLNTNSGPITFATLNLTASNGNGLEGTNNSGAINVTTAAGSVITTTNGSAINITNGSGNPAININLTTVTTTNSPVNAINLDRVGGAGIQITGAVTLDMAAGSGNVVDITNSISTNVFIGTNGTTHAAVNLNDRRNTGAFVDASSGTIRFGNTTIPNPNNAGGYGIRIEDSGATVIISSATISNANVLSAQADDGDGLPDSDGDGDAIFLTNNTGSFTLNGGTLSNSGNDGIDIRNSSALILSGVTISTPGQDVTGATGAGFGGHCIAAWNLTGISSITGCTISGFNVGSRDGIYLTNGSSTMTLTIHGTLFQNAIGNRGLGVLGYGAAVMTIIVGGPTNNVATNCTFQNILGTALQSVAGGSVGSTSRVDLTVQNTTFQNAPTDGKNNLLASLVEAAKSNVIIRNNTFNNVMLTASTGEALINVNNDGTLAGNQLDLLIEDNVISNVGRDLNNCGGGAVGCRGPLNTILVFIDDQANVPSTIVIDGNTITDVQQGGIFLDMANTGANSSDVEAKIINNIVGTDAAPVGRGVGGSVQSGIRVERRRNNSMNGNVLVSGNSVRNGIGGAGSTLNGPGIFARTKANSNLSITVTNNSVNTNLTGGVAEMRFDTNPNEVGDIPTPTQCNDINMNTFPAGAAAIIDINEINGTHNVEQASAVALAAANGGVTVTVDAGVSFGINCADPPN